MNRNPRALIWLLAYGIIGFAIIQRVTDQGLQPPLSPRYTLYAIPAAISIMRGAPHDYTAQMSIAGFFLPDPNGDTNDQIKRALAAKNLDDAGLWFVSGDDKGLIDLTYASFALFGATTESLLKTITMLIGVSAFLFGLQFWRQDSAMTALLSVLCGLCLTLYTFGTSDQSTSIIEPRFLGIISLLSSLHMMLFMTIKGRIRFAETVLLLLQATMIAFVLHLRSSEFWQTLAVLLFTLCAAVANHQCWRRALLVVALLSSAAAGLQVYKQSHYHAHYFQSEVSTRVFWHNALLGLATNPALRQRYEIYPLDDVSATKLVRKEMIAQGRENDAAILFPNDNYSAGNFKDFNWSRYEGEARAAYFEIIASNPWEVARTYLLISPKIAWESYRRLNGALPDHEDPFLRKVTQISPDEERQSRGRYFKPVRLTTLSAALLAIITCIWSRPPFKAHLLALAILFLVSTIPALLATPAIQYIQLSLTICTALFYFLGILLTVKLANACFPKLRKYLDGLSPASCR